MKETAIAGASFWAVIVLFTITAEPLKTEIPFVMVLFEIVGEPLRTRAALMEQLFIFIELPQDILDAIIAFSSTQPEPVCSFQPLLPSVNVIPKSGEAAPPLKWIGSTLLPLAVNVPTTRM
jgi:hypothetical protein